MLREELQILVEREPFEPFRIKLVNGDFHDVFHPHNTAILEWSVSIMPPDQNWILFPLDKIASIKSLMADFPGELAKHEQP